MSPGRRRKHHHSKPVQEAAAITAASGRAMVPSWIVTSLTWMAVAISVFILTYRPITDPDTWFHLELGEWIASNNALPRTDPFSYTAGETPYVPSGWATAWLMYQHDRIYPESSLGYILMVTVAVLLASAIILRRGQRCGTLVTTGLLLMAALTAAVVRFSPRPDVFSVLFLTAALALMSRAWSMSPAALSNKDEPPFGWRLWLLVPLIILWANLHAGVLVALPFLAVYLIWLLRRWQKSRKRDWLLAAVPVVMACFAWLLNPYGWGLVGLARRIARMPDVGWVMEWMPFFKAGFPLAVPVYVCMAILLSALIWVFLRDRRAFHPVELMWLAMLIALVLLQRRQVSLFAFGTVLILARHVSFFEGWIRRRSNVLAASLPLLAAAVVVWTQVSGANGNGGGKPGFGRNCTTFPCYTADFLHNNPPPEPIFNSYNFGGYLLHRLYPATKVYIDGRLDTYPEQVWLDMLAVEEIRLSIDDLVERYGVQTFVIGVSDSFGDPIHLASRLANHPEFQLVHLDDTATVFVRRSLENIEWLERYGYRTLNPWDLDKMTANIRESGDIDAVTREMGRLLGQSPVSAGVHALAAYIAFLYGDQVTMDAQLTDAGKLQINHPLLIEVNRRLATAARSR